MKAERRRRRKERPRKDAPIVSRMVHPSAGDSGNNIEDNLTADAQAAEAREAPQIRARDERAGHATARASKEPCGQSETRVARKVGAPSLFVWLLFRRYVSKEGSP
ncbi:hypothetical protein MRX96_013662 [Rhipicephalus microplus]